MIVHCFFVLGPFKKYLLDSDYTGIYLKYHFSEAATGGVL